MPGIDKTMHEFGEGKLHSGSKSGPVVKNRAQAIAIGLSEERKAGHAVEKPHHHEMPHKTHSGHHSEMDGAGRKGFERGDSEHKAPTHPAGSHTVPGGVPASEGVAGHPGNTLALGDNGHIVGKSFAMGEKPSDHSEMEGQGPTAGHPGMQHAPLAIKSHGFGHAAHQRRGALRHSGHPGAHRIGDR